MGIDSYITDPKDHKNAHIITHDDKDNSNALAVATHPLKQFKENTIFFTNNTLGINMNIQAGTFGGTPEAVYDENTEWTTSAITGTWIFASGTVGAISPHSGSVMINAVATVDTNTMQLTKGSDLVLTDYTAITGWIALSDWDNRGTKAINLLGWNTTTAAQVGTTVNLANYINIGTITTWQKFTIPLEDMSLNGATINAFRVTTVDIGPGTPPDYFLDEIDIQQAGGASDISSASFSIQPYNETWLHIFSYTFFFADDNYAPVLSNGLMTGVPYDSLLGVSSLAGGLIYQRFENGEVVVTEKIQQLSSLFRMPSTTISGYGISKDYAGSWVSIESPVAEPLILKAEEDDRVRWTVSEDLSGLSILNISAACKIEQRK